MNVQQIRYVIAVAETHHFGLAADKCYVTQSTLSTMILKFEDEIGVKIFDRRKKPVEITTEGQIVIERLRLINKEIEQLQELLKEMKGEVKGHLTLGVIPTVAPFLLPLFIQKFVEKFPELNIEIREITTNEIISQIKDRKLDIGILSVPVNDPDIVEVDLYDEAFVFYDAKKGNGKTTSVYQIDAQRLCLLEEGHCLRTQVLHLCEAHKIRFNPNKNLNYKVGSIDSLLRFVNSSQACTLLPLLATVEFNKEQKEHLSTLSSPVPYRSIGLVVHRHFVKKKVLEVLKDDIINAILRVLPQRYISGERLTPL